MVAAIGRAINAVAPIGRIPIVRFAASDPDDIRIRRCNRDCADRQHGLLVENWVERNAAVARLEHAAMSKRDVKDKWIAWIDRNIGDAAGGDPAAGGAEAGGDSSCANAIEQTNKP